MRIKRFKEYEKINETSEFNLQRMVPDTAPNAIWPVDNPQLSMNAYDNKQSAISNAVARVNDILFSLSRTNTLNQLRSSIALEEQDIQSLTIQRILKNGVSYDVYIRFIIEGKEYWGVVCDITGSNTNVKSEVFKDHELIQTPEWVIKTKGTIVKYIKEWMTPKSGNYKLLNKEVVCYSRETGNMLKMNKDIVIEVVRSNRNEITVKYKNDYYKLIDDNFVYFNWWFEPV